MVVTGAGVQRVLRFGFVLLGVLGGACILYGVIAAVTAETGRPLERVALAILTAGTIYVFGGAASHDPDPISKEFTGWAVMLAGVIALVTLYRNGSLPPVMVNGVAMMAVSGALLRMQPRPPGW